MMFGAYLREKKTVLLCGGIPGKYALLDSDKGKSSTIGKTKPKCYGLQENATSWSAYKPMPWNVVAPSYAVVKRFAEDGNEIRDFYVIGKKLLFKGGSEINFKSFHISGGYETRLTRDFYHGTAVILRPEIEEWIHNIKVLKVARAGAVSVVWNGELQNALMV